MAVEWINEREKIVVRRKRGVPPPVLCTLKVLAFEVELATKAFCNGAETVKTAH